jgi:serine/threonine protein kinase
MLSQYLKYRKSPKQLLVHGIDISFRFDLNYTDVQTDNLETLLSIIQNINQVVTGKHVSKSKIYKGTVYGRPVYVKEFSLSDTGLKIEKEIYRYLRSLQYQTDQPLSSEYRKHFIVMLLCIKVEGVRGIKDGKMYIISEDSGGESVGDFLNRLTGKVYMKLQVKIMMEILYLIYLLHSMGIIHNDIHFGNIIIVKDDKNPTKTFTMYGKSYTITNYPYYLKMYDFDRSCISDQNIMKDKCKYGKNKQKDVFNWFALWWLPKDEYQTTYDHAFKKCWENFLRQLKNQIKGYRTLIRLLERNNSRRAGTFWSHFCPQNENDSCDDFKLDVLNNLETIVNAYNTAFQPILTS